MPRFFKAAFACAVLMSTTNVFAQGRSANSNRPASAVTGKSRAQQALDSRRSLLNRAAPQARNSAANNAVQQGRNPLTRPGTASSLETVKGRRGQERSSSRRPTFRTRQPQNRSAAARRRGLNDRPRFSKDLQNQRSADRQKIRQAAGQSNDDRRRDVRTVGQDRMPLSNADKRLAKRLADIDHLRDVAVENGNERLLQQTDRLEELARQQHAQATTGEKLRANELFSPDGVGESRTEAKRQNDFATRDSRARRNNATTPPATKRRGFFSLDRLKGIFRLGTKPSSER